MKKFLLITIILTLVGICKAQTFVYTEITPPASATFDEIEKAKQNIGKEVILTFTDNDVRITTQDKNGVLQSGILDNMGKNIYRKYLSNDKNSYTELELSTFMGYIKEGTITNIKNGVFNGSFKFRRKELHDFGL